MFPIKYIDNNLVWNKDNEVFAYYELIPYNYSFLSAEQKFIVHDSFRQLIAQSREGKIHALQIATESSIRSMQEQSKKLVTGKLKEVACQKIDEQTEALVSMIGDNQVDYRFFLGFKLMVTEEQLNLKNIKKSAWLTFKEFLHEVNHTLMNDFVSMPNDEINRYMKMEKLLENKISRRFKVRRLEIHDFGYLMEHLYGRDGIAYEDYEYQLPKKKLQKETLIKYYDLIRPTRCVIEESQRYLRLEHEDRESYVSYFTVNAIVGELDFPSSEIFYFQQQQFTFPVDTSMNVEIVENRKALTTVRNKKKELKDLDNHAYQAGSETSSNVVDALDSVDELETDLDQTKESMYKLSYVVRVSADDLDELKRRCDEVKDFYDDLNVKLVRPAGDMLGLHSEFLPASKRYINDYVQYVKSDFLAGLGFGATQQLGETTGIYMGYSVDTGRNVYLQPSLASQGVKGTVSLYLSNATGYVVQEAYKLDFINDMADSIGQSIQTLAGVTENGFSSTGFYVGFLLLIILIVGLYVAYTGLIKRETSKALHAVINFVVVFVLSASFIAYAPDYIKKINEFSSDISTASLDLGTKIMLPNSDSEGKDSVDLIRDSLFSIQVEQPWLLLQFGNSNAEEIGTDRVEALVSVSPEDEDGKTREEVVKTEIEDNDNNNLTIPQVVNRLGMVFFLLFFNLGITIFVFLLTGMMLFSQILFIIFAMFLPISFLLSMIPSYESMAKQAIVRVFNTIMTRAGITLIVTVAFSISSMFYNISTDYPFFMVAFLQIVCFAGIYMKLGDLMSMFSLNAGDSQNMGRRIFRRPYLFMRHRARRMEHRIARAVSAGGISGGVAGAVAGSAVAGKRAERKNTASKENRGNTTSSMGQRAGSKVGAVLDTKNKVKDKANAVKENIKDMPTQTAYAVYSAKEKAKSSVSDFKRGMVQEQQSRQTGRLEKQEQHRQNIADKRMELQKAQEARQRKTDGSATTGATRPHERPATASTIPKPSAEKMQEVKRPATATTSKASEPVKTNVVKERPLSSGASDKKATQPAQPVHRQNVEKVVSQETRQNYKAERTTKKQTFEQSKRTTEHTEKNRNLVTKKGQKKK